MNLYERTYASKWKAWNKAVIATEAELLEVYEMTYRGLEADILTTATLGEFDRVAQMKMMRQTLKTRMYELSNNVNGIITTGIQNQINGVLDDQLKALGAYITDHRWNIPYMPMGGEMSSLQLGTFEYMAKNPAGGIPLSKRIWRLHQESYKEMSRILNRGLLEGKSAVRIARDCEIFLADPRGSARSAGVVKALRTRAVKAKAAGDTERARRLFTKARALGEKLPQMPQGIYRSPLKNALRMTRSEASRAQFVTTVQYAQEREWITRIKWALSAGHPRIDICDDLTGEYEKGNVPFPPHPHCICHLEYVLSPAVTGKGLPPAQMPPAYFDIIGKRRITDPVLLAQRQVALKGLEKVVGKPIAIEPIPLSPEQKIARIENKIKNRELEKAYAVDAKGKVVYSQGGTATEIDINYAQAERFRHKTLVHNHPIDIGFSVGDIEFAFENQLKQIRAVTTKHKYIMKPPKGYDYFGQDTGWGKSQEFIQTTYDKHRFQARRLARIQIAESKLTYEQANEWAMHYVWSKTSIDMGLQYQKVSF